ncbi:MAG: sialate O-acetylesterase, partial [Phycisphaeraceae bacterium]|nr:sialate O-acetylesterase [Phycisphaeraceae bacterium]
GHYYTQMLQEVQEGLNQLKRDFPNRKGAAYELAGFIWLQGWNDMFDPEGLNQYEENLVNLIKDVRVAWKTPDLPVIIGELGNGGPKAGKNMLAIRQAQAAAAAHTEFNGTVTFVSTTDFARPAEESPNTGHGHHWFGNSESYFLIGNALGKAMVESLRSSY